jgi:hypothetical protein
MAPSSRPDAPARPPWPDRGAALLVAVVASLAYVLLYARIDIDDTNLIVYPVVNGQLVWSPAHLLMHPTALLLYRLAGSPDDVVMVLRLANTACAAAALGLGFVLLRRCGVGMAIALAGTTAAWGSFALLQLATSGHVKLFGLPFLMLGLVLLAGRARRGPAGQMAALVGAGMAWGLAAAYLASFALVGPVVAALVFLRAIAARAWPAARRAVLDYAVLGTAMAAVLGGALLSAWMASGAAGSGTSFLAWAAEDTARAETPGISAMGLARTAVGMVKGFAWLFLLPEGARAWLAGEAPGLDFGDLRVLGEVGAVLATLAWIALSALAVVTLWRRGREADLVVAGALLASVAFCVGWGHFEADFQFPVTVLAAFSLALCPKVPRLAMACGMLLAGYNIAAYAAPRLTIDSRATYFQLQSLVRPGDLMVCGCAFNGRHTAYYYPLPADRRIRVIIDLVEPRGIVQAEAFQAALEGRIAATLARGGRVYLFDLLDPGDWGPPWPQLHAIGVRKDILRQRLEAAFAVSPPRDVGGLTYLELGAKP